MRRQYAAPAVFTTCNTLAAGWLLVRTNTPAKTQQAISCSVHRPIQARGLAHAVLRSPAVGASRQAPDTPIVYTWQLLAGKHATPCLTGHPTGLSLHSLLLQFLGCVVGLQSDSEPLDSSSLEEEEELSEELLLEDESLSMHGSAAPFAMSAAAIGCFFMPPSSSSMLLSLSLLLLLLLEEEEQLLESARSAASLSILLITSASSSRFSSAAAGMLAASSVALAVHSLLVEAGAAGMHTPCTHGLLGLLGTAAAREGATRMLLKDSMILARSLRVGC